jgi:cell division septation protein DedD
MSKYIFGFVGFNLLLLSIVNIWLNGTKWDFLQINKKNISIPLNVSEGKAAPKSKVAKMFTIELGVFGKKDEAERELQRLSKIGIQAFYSPYRTEHGDIFYKIRRGVYSSKQNAEEIIKNLAKQRIKGRVVEL